MAPASDSGTAYAAVDAGVCDCAVTGRGCVTEGDEVSPAVAETETGLMEEFDAEARRRAGSDGVQRQREAELTAQREDG